MKDFVRKESEVIRGRGGVVRLEYRERRDGGRAQVVVDCVPLEEGLPKQMQRCYHYLIAAPHQQGRPLEVKDSTKGAGKRQRHQKVTKMQDYDTQGYISLAEIRAFGRVLPILFSVGNCLTLQPVQAMLERARFVFWTVQGKSLLMCTFIS